MKLILFYGLLILLFYISSTESLKDKFASATVSTGKIKGYVIEPNADRTNAVNIFKGIPFAEPPVGELRFALPKLMKPWEGIWNATFYKPACPSNTTATSSPQKVTHEDCLYLNIFADQICMTKKCPVLYIVHGGDFYYDSAVMFNDEYIIQSYASKGMIVVIPAYRLGLFGFLDLGSDDPVPRNLGIHDLVSSLYWVQKEIHAFGGDPKRVTIFGNSVGGSAIAFLSTSPTVPLLWSQAFISSPDCVMMENKLVPQTMAVLERAGCLYAGNNTNMTLSKEMQLKCLRTLDWKQLIGIQRDIEEQSLLFDGVEPDNLLFNDKSFTQLLGQYKAVPTVIGTTREEFKVHEDEVEKSCEKYVKVFDYKEDATIQACIDKYTDAVDENGNVPVVADMIRAEIFRIALQIVKRKDPVWLYSWELENHLYHTGDVSFLIGLHPVDPQNATWKEKLMLKYMPTVLHNFVTKSVPDKEWVEFTSYGDNYEVLDFTNTTRTLRGPYPVFQSWYPEAVSFWLGDLSAIEKAAREARHRNESVKAEEKWDIVAEDAREHQWKKFRDALNKSQERFKKWTDRKNVQWERVREKNEKEYAEKIQKIHEKNEAERKQQENGITKFTDLILVQSLKETEETLKARRRQLDNVGDKKGVEKIDEMLRDLGDWKDTVGEDERNHWIDKFDKMPKHNHHHEHESNSDAMKHEKSESSDYHNLLDSLSPQERDAARIIWEEQEKALNRQHHPNGTNPNIGQRINGTIDDIRNTLGESNPGSIDTEHDQKIYQDLTNKTRWQQKNNETIDKIKDAKNDINNKINDTKNDVSQKWNDTINDVNNRIDDAKNDIENKKQEIRDNYNDTNKNANDKIIDQQKLRNDTYDIYKDAQKDVNQKLNDTKNDINDKISDTKQDVQKRINDTNDDIENDKYKGINVNEKDWIRRHNGTEGNITDDLKNIKNDIVDKWDDVKNGAENTWNDVKNGVENGWNNVVNNNNNISMNDRDWQQRNNTIDVSKHHHDAIKDANEKIRKLEERKQRISGKLENGNDYNDDDDERMMQQEKERKEALKIVAENNEKDVERMNEKMKELKNQRENWEESFEVKKQRLQEAEAEVREAAAEQREAAKAKYIVEKRLQDAKEKQVEAIEAQTKAKKMAAEEKQHLQKAKEEAEKAVIREEAAKKEQAKEKQNLIEAAEKERIAAAKEAKATQKAIQQELDLTEMQIYEAQQKLKKAEHEMDKEIEIRKIAAQAVVDSLRNATYQRFLERQRLEEKYQNFVNYLRNETMKDISDKLHHLSHNQNKLPPNTKVYDYLKNRSITSNLPQYESQLFSPLSFLAIPQFDSDSEIDENPVVANNETVQLQQLWSAFWVVLTVATLLAFVLCLNAIIACMKPNRPTQGYFYNDDPGFFTEKSKIIVAQYPHYS
uniref:Carboxylesterase type B domain-containing protein n=1 Tax=Panagrolaimus sp. ES5 TaxID=591445 RepID=A0AC34GUB2_9BILA